MYTLIFTLLIVGAVVSIGAALAGLIMQLFKIPSLSEWRDRQIRAMEEWQDDD